MRAGRPRTIRRGRALTRTSREVGAGRGPAAGDVAHACTDSTTVSPPSSKPNSPIVRQTPEHDGGVTR